MPLGLAPPAFVGHCDFTLLLTPPSDAPQIGGASDTFEFHHRRQPPVAPFACGSARGSSADGGCLPPVTVARRGARRSMATLWASTGELTTCVEDASSRERLAQGGRKPQVREHAAPLESTRQMLPNRELVSQG